MVKKLIACVFTVCCMMSSAIAGTVQQASTQSNHDYLILGIPDSAKITPEENDPTAMSVIYLADADEKLSAKMEHSESNEASEYKDRMFTGNKIHKYLGIGSVGAALLTILMPKEEDGPHEYFAKTSAVLGLGAVATGLAFHYEDVSVAGGLKDPDNLHALWAGLGAVGIGMAASTGPDTPHATYGALGTIAMMIGVKYTW